MVNFILICDSSILDMPEKLKNAFILTVYFQITTNSLNSSFFVADFLNTLKSRNFLTTFLI